MTNPTTTNPVSKPLSIGKAFDIIIFYFAIISSIALGLLYLNALHFRWDHVLVGFLTEIGTLPLLIGMPVLLIIEILRLAYNKFQLRSYSFYSIIITFLTLSTIWRILFFSAP